MFLLMRRIVFSFDVNGYGALIIERCWNHVVFVCASVCLTVLLFVRLSVNLTAWLSVCLIVLLYVCMSVYLTTWLSVCLTACLSVCLTLWLYVWLSDCLYDYFCACYLYVSPFNRLSNCMYVFIFSFLDLCWTVFDGVWRIHEKIKKKFWNIDAIISSDLVYAFRVSDVVRSLRLLKALAVDCYKFLSFVKPCVMSWTFNRKMVNFVWAWTSFKTAACLFSVDYNVQHMFDEERSSKYYLHNSLLFTKRCRLPRTSLFTW